jgi:site-specific DNA recombinase
VRTVPAGEIEQAVISQLRAVFRSPEMIAQTSLAAKQLGTDELERLQSERHNLETRLAELTAAAARLTDSGMPDVATSEEMQRVNAELVGTQHGLQDVSADIEVLQAVTISERDVMEALQKLDPVWEELYPLEQTRIVQLLVEKVIVNPDGLSIQIRSDGLHSLVSELKDTLDDRDERTCKA